MTLKIPKFDSLNVITFLFLLLFFLISFAFRTFQPLSD